MKLNVVTRKFVSASELPYWVIIGTADRKCTSCIGFTTKELAQEFIKDLDERKTDLKGFLCEDFKAQVHMTLLEASK